jgi:hypothetical protein
VTTPDVWAAASAQQATAPSSAATEAPAESNLDGAYAEEESQLFSSGGGAGPSILNKTHYVGTVRTGIITKAPYDVQSRDINGKPKFWQVGSPAPVTDAVNPITNKPNRPVMDTVLALQTEYRMDGNERAAINRDDSFEDEGQRSFSAGGRHLKTLRDAIGKAKITSGAQMVGKRFTVKRAGKVPNPNGNDSWVLEITISEA